MTTQTQRKLMAELANLPDPLSVTCRETLTIRTHDLPATVEVEISGGTYGAGGEPTECASCGHTPHVDTFRNARFHWRNGRFTRATVYTNGRQKTCESIRQALRLLHA